MDRELTGTIKRLVNDRGFGFIGADNVDYFFHKTACDAFERLRTGDRVTFVSVRGSKGPRADKVRPA